MVNKIVLRGDGLAVDGTLQRVDYNPFRDACDTLLRNHEPEIYFDLRKCSYLSSLFIGALVDAITQIKAQKRLVRVEVSAEIGRLLHMAHLYHLFNYEVWETQTEKRS